MNVSQPNNPLPINIPLDKTEPIKCSCGNDVFIIGLMFRKVSRFLTTTGKEGIIPLEVYCCSKCNVPLEETLPDALKTPKIS